MTGGDTRHHISAEVEEQILNILDTTEPGPGREAALAKLALTDSMRLAVKSWLSTAGEEDDELDTFLKTPASGAAPTPLGVDLPRRMGDYELRSVLGKGGMGIVYEATDLRLGRTVALKILPGHFADNPKRLQRFEREVRAIAALRHPCIVSVYEAGSLERTPYFTMELVDGSSLDKVIHHLQTQDASVSEFRRRHWTDAIESDPSELPLEDRDRSYLEGVCQLVIDVADALAHAHDHKIVHRDVKPSNIMVTGRGSAKLFDFGLARIEDQGVVTRTSEVIGSPHYMSPEQVAGKDVDQRSDVYSLGVTLYELLTLKVPFAGSTPQKIYHAIVHEDPPRPSTANPALPRDLETICQAATDKSPERRYQTARDLAADLQRFLRFEPVHARPLGSMTRSARWLRRNLATATIAILGFSTAATALIYLLTTVSLREANQQLKDARAGTLQADIDARRAEDRAAAAQRAIQTAEREVAASNRRAQAANEKSGTLRAEISDLEAKEVLAAARAAEAEERAKKQADILKEVVTNLASQSTRLVAQQQQVASLKSEKEKLAGERSKLASAIQQTQLELGNLEENHRVTTVNRLLMEASTLRASNPGLGLILAREASRRTQDIQQSTLTRLDQGLRSRVNNALLEMLRTCQETLTYTAHDAVLTAVTFSPSGQNMVSASRDGVVHLWDRFSKRLFHKARLPAFAVHVEFISEDTVLLATDAGAIYLWDTRSEDAPALQESLHHNERVPRHVGDGGRFLVAHTQAESGPLRVVQLGTVFSAAPLSARDQYRGFAFRSEGDGIAAITTLGHIHVYDLDPLRRVLDQPCASNPLAVAFDASGTRVAWLEENGSVCTVNVATKERYLNVKVNDGYLIGTGQISFCDGDRNLLVSGTGTRDHFLLDAQSGHAIAKIPADLGARQFTLSPLERSLACIANDSGGLQLIRTSTGDRLTTLNGHQRTAVSQPPSVAFSPLGTTVASVHGDKTVRLWSTRPGGALTLLGPGQSDLTVPADSEGFLSGTFDVDRDHVLARTRRGLYRWNRKTGRRTLAFIQPQLIPTNDLMIGATSVACGPRGELHLLHDGQPRSLPSTPTRPVVGLEHISSWPGGRIALTYAGSPRRQLRLLNLHGAEEMRIPLPEDLNGGGLPTPSARGDRFFTGYDDLWILQARPGEHAIRLPFSRRPAAFSPDGTHIVTSTSFGVKVWNTTTGAPVHTLDDLPQDDSHLTALAYSPDGERLATGWNNGTIRVHDTANTPGQAILTFAAHRLRVRSLSFSGDGESLLSCSHDGTARVWDSRDGRQTLQFRPGVPCNYACFDQASEAALVASERSLHVFPLDPRALAERSCPRNLSAAERKRFGL